PAGEYCLSSIPGLGHGSPAYRFRVHVVAEGAQIAVDKGFEVDDGAVGFALAGRRDRVLRETFGADTGDMGFQLIGFDQFGVADALDTGYDDFGPQGFDPGLPGIAIDIAGHREQAGR